MITYCATRLLEWAQWSRARMDGFYGIGGAQFDYEEPMPREAGHYASTIDPRCMETEEAVAWLKFAGRRIQGAVLVHYRDHPQWSADMQAELLRVSKSGFWRLLHTADLLLLEYFFDREFGCVPQLEELRARGLIPQSEQQQQSGEPVDNYGGKRVLTQFAKMAEGGKNQSKQNFVDTTVKTGAQSPSGKCAPQKPDERKLGPVFLRPLLTIRR